ncbi:hypothetical protein M407DRAFT_24737 [Tulasnella calospora MUT 4182]|uniref:Uncharacterized protein n=1 Tax=Tulasnella calospora MUT 4182 TaxID=1051891 RepID=A0A0C3QHF4_9AGAM|nr:hypothetical protein M407DRAFT_24737 [Tulasnella calospora MUT 4182]
MEDSTAFDPPHDSIKNPIIERVKNFTLAILTGLDPKAVFTTLPRDARETTIVVPDTTYKNELDSSENRYFLVCPDDATYSTVFTVLQSEGVAIQPKFNISYWKYIRKRIEKGDVYGDTSSLPAVHQASADRPEAHSYARPQLAADTPPAEDAATSQAGRIIYGKTCVDVITKLIVQFSGVPLGSLIALHMNKVASGPTLHFADHLGPSGQPSCLQTIVDHPTPWTPRAVKATQKMASQEIKVLKREFREKYQPTADKCTNEPQHTLTLDEVMEIIDRIEDRQAKKKWMANKSREMRGLKKEVTAMVLEYLALMAHCRKLQRACVAAVTNAYDIEFVLLPDPSFPTPL